MGRTRDDRTAEPAPTPLPFAAFDPDDKRIGDKDLKKSMVLVNTLNARGQADFFPEDLTPQVVYDIVAKHRDFLVDRSHGRIGSRAATAKLNKDRKTANAKLARLDKVVNGNYPSSHEKRVTFFPQTQGREPTLDERLTAMANGIEEHGLRPLAKDLAAVGLRHLAADIKAGESGRPDDIQRDNLQVVRANCEHATKEVYHRLGENVRGYYGLTNPELAEYGLKVRATKLQRKRKSGADAVVKVGKPKNQQPVASATPPVAPAVPPNGHAPEGAQPVRPLDDAQA